MRQASARRRYKKKRGRGANQNKPIRFCTLPIHVIVYLSA